MPGHSREPVTTQPLPGSKIEAMRSDLDWTQRELAAFFEVSHVTAHKWEKRGVDHSEIIKGALRALIRATQGLQYYELDDMGDRLLGRGAAWFLSNGMDEEVGPIRVFDLRQALGWTQEEFGAFFGVSYTTPAVWESEDININEATRGSILAVEKCLQSRKAGDDEYVETLRERGISDFLVNDVPR